MSTALLENRVMVITGGNGGIGAALIAKALDEGAKVVVWDITKVERDGVHSILCDVTDEAAVDAARDETLKAFGRIDILINCVGITGPTAEVADYTLSDWERVMRINLTSTFLCCRAVIAPMKAQNYGRIVNLSSVAGKEGNPNQSAYSASKAGMIGLTKSLGKELAETGIRVNAVTPAIIETELVHQMTEAQINLVLSKVPMKRAGKPEEVAELLLWLASEKCSFSTGATFDISGGRATY